MNFEFFEKLTALEAKTFLREFLDVGVSAHPDMTRDAKLEGVENDMSLTSIVPVLTWLLSKAKTTPKKDNLTVPEWIKSSKIYSEALIEFEDTSKPLIFYGGFYVGQSMIKQSLGLTWATGNPETAEKHMPVVTGFRHSEMATILIVENLFLRILREPNRLNDIEKAIHSWISRIPK